VEGVPCFSASCLAKLSSAKTTASWPCVQIDSAWSGVRSGRKIDARNVVSRVSLLLLYLLQFQLVLQWRHDVTEMMAMEASGFVSL
jgi:hypothetical protein